MAEVKWIKIVTDIFDDEKIQLIESMPEKDSLIVIWFKLLCFAGKQNNGGVFVLNDRIKYTDEMLAAIFRRPLNTVRLALNTFEQYGMIEIIDDVITIPKWEKHQSIDTLEKIKEQNRIRVAKHREKQRLLTGNVTGNVTSNVTANVTVTPCNAIEKEEDKEKEEDIDNTILPSGEPTPKPTKTEINDFFEYIWSLYPVKKGKGQVSDARKKALFEIGAEELERAIERYLTDLKKEEWRKPQNGSTFFNSGYIDYLDSNYEPPVQNSEPQTVKDRPLSDYDRFMGELKAMYNESEE